MLSKTVLWDQFFRYLPRLRPPSTGALNDGLGEGGMPHASIVTWPDHASFRRLDGRFPGEVLGDARGSWFKQKFIGDKIKIQ